MNIINTQYFIHLVITTSSIAFVSCGELKEMVEILQKESKETSFEELSDFQKTVKIPQKIAFKNDTFILMETDGKLPRFLDESESPADPVGVRCWRCQNLHQLISTVTFLRSRANSVRGCIVNKYFGFLTKPCFDVRYVLGGIQFVVTQGVDRVIKTNVLDNDYLPNKLFRLKHVSRAVRIYLRWMDITWRASYFSGCLYMHIKPPITNIFNPPVELKVICVAIRNPIKGVHWMVRPAGPTGLSGPAGISGPAGPVGLSGPTGPAKRPCVNPQNPQGKRELGGKEMLSAMLEKDFSDSVEFSNEC